MIRRRGTLHAKYQHPLLAKFAAAEGSEWLASMAQMLGAALRAACRTTAQLERRQERERRRKAPLRPAPTVVIVPTEGQDETR